MYLGCGQYCGWREGLYWGIAGVGKGRGGCRGGIASVGRKCGGRRGGMAGVGSSTLRMDVGAYGCRGSGWCERFCWCFCGCNKKGLGVLRLFTCVRVLGVFRDVIFLSRVCASLLSNITSFCCCCCVSCLFCVSSCSLSSSVSNSVIFSLTVAKREV